MDITTFSTPGIDDAIRRRNMLRVLLGGMFIALIDVSIVNVAGPTIVSNLHATGSTLQLVISGYSLSYAVLLITGARLGDEFGHRRIFMTGVAGFTVSSLLCGLAPTSLLLISARLLQGASAALMVPQVLSLIQVHYQGAERQRALGLYASTLGLGFIVGQVLGGVLVSADIFGLSWRVVFLVNLPVGFTIVLCALKWLPVAEVTIRRRLDYGGVLLLSFAMTSLVLPLIVGREDGWPVWSITALLASPILFALFIWFQQRELRMNRQPLFDLAVFRNAGFTVATIAQFLFMASYAGFLLSTTLYIQEGLGASAVKSGLSLAPMSVAFIIMSAFWPRIPAYVQRWLLPLGLVLVAINYVIIGLVARHTDSLNLWFVLSMIPAGFGFAVGVSPLIGKVLAQVQPQQIPSASGMVSTNAQTSLVVGTASYGSFYLAHANANAGHALQLTLLLLAVATTVSAVCTLRLK